MRRWVYILMGAFGAGLVVLAGFMLWLMQSIEPRYGPAITIISPIVIVVGLTLCVIGFVQGRRAGELDISAYAKTPRRDYGVAGTEIDFVCPICHKPYRASPLLAGKPFKCRECRESFDVPRVRSLTSGAAVQG
jgi:hypothetical protein